MGTIYRFSCQCGYSGEALVGMGMLSSSVGYELRLCYCSNCDDFRSYPVARDFNRLDEHPEIGEKIGKCSTCGSPAIEPLVMDVSEEDVIPGSPPRLKGPNCRNCSEHRLVIDLSGVWD